MVMENKYKDAHRFANRWDFGNCEQDQHYEETRCNVLQRTYILYKRCTLNLDVKLRPRQGKIIHQPGVSDLPVMKMRKNVLHISFG